MQAMEASATNKFLIDGFPRNEDNLDGWEKQMGDKAEIKFVLFFDCPEDVRPVYKTPYLVIYHIV